MTFIAVTIYVRILRLYLSVRFLFRLGLQMITISRPATSIANFQYVRSPEVGNKSEVASEIQAANSLYKLLAFLSSQTYEDVLTPPVIGIVNIGVFDC
jgi:hypothetical protein